MHDDVLLAATAAALSRSAPCPSTHSTNHMVSGFNIHLPRVKNGAQSLCKMAHPAAPAREKHVVMLMVVFVVDC